MGDQDDKQEVLSLLSRLKPILLKRVVLASRLSPETLPDEIMLLESVSVSTHELG